MKLTQKDQKRINDVLRSRDIHPDQYKHINCVRMHPTETDAHWEGKQRKCRQLYKEDRPFLCEVWTRDRKQRFDILELIDNLDIEISTGKSKNKKYTNDIVIHV